MYSTIYGRDIGGIIRGLVIVLKYNDQQRYVIAQLDAASQRTGHKEILIQPEIPMINFHLIIVNTVGYNRPACDRVQFMDALNKNECFGWINYNRNLLEVSYYKTGHIRLRQWGIL